MVIRQLTTAFDIHATLKQILNTIPKAIINVTKSVPTITPSVNVSQSNLFRGFSLLNKLPFRTCEEAGIPEEYCACMPPVAYTKNLTIVRMAAEAVVQNINSELSPVCEQLKVASVIGAAILNYTSNKNSESSSNPKVDFLVSFLTYPGNFRYEALVEFTNIADKFTRVDNILRTNTKSRNTDCLTHKQASLELKCYCRKSVFSITSY